MSRIDKNGLAIEAVLHDFLVNEVLPGLAVDAEKFFADFSAIVHDLAPRNRALLAKREKSFRCQIIGEGPLENELRGQINEMGLQREVELPGPKPQTQLRRRLAAANIFVLPSVIDPDGGMDNLPTVIMEAMATGLPVVSTDIAGIPEMIIENETGFLVRPGDTAAMAMAIERVISDSSLATRLGHSGSQRARALFSIEENVRELCSLL